MQSIIDQVDLDELGIKHKAKEEFERYSDFRYEVLGLDKEQKRKQLEVDSKNYAKHILKKGTVAEKRDLFSCLKSKLVLADKKLGISQE